MEALKLDLPRRSMVGQWFVYWVSPNADQLREGNLTGQKFRTSDMLPTNGWQSKSRDPLSFRLSQKHVVPHCGVYMMMLFKLFIINFVHFHDIFLNLLGAREM